MHTPHGKHHRIRKAAIGAAAGVAAAVAVSLIFGSHQAPRQPDAAQRHIAAAAAPAAPVLSAGESVFVSVVRAALADHGVTNAATDAQIASIGDQICKIRGTGLSQAGVIAVVRVTGTRLDMTPPQFVKAAEQAICPAEYRRLDESSTLTQFAARFITPPQRHEPGSVCCLIQLTKEA